MDRRRFSDDSSLSVDVGNDNSISLSPAYTSTPYHSNCHSFNLTLPSSSSPSFLSSSNSAFQPFNRSSPKTNFKSVESLAISSTSVKNSKLSFSSSSSSSLSHSMLQDTGYNSMTSDTQNSHLSDKENKKSIIKNQNKQMINDTKKVKQERTKFTDIQKWTLNQFYLNQNRYPSIHEIERLGTQLNLSDAKIRVWFQNKRVRHRPDKKQLTDSSRFTITTSQQQSQTLSFMLSSLVSPLSPSVHLSIKQFYEQHQLHF